MKLQANHSESLLRVTRDANETISRIKPALKLLDIDVPARAEFTLDYKSADEKILYQAINASDFLDLATDRMIATLERRNMQMTDEHRAIKEAQQSILSRTFRVLWECTLNKTDSHNFKSLIKTISNISVWEDEPCVLRGLSYSKVANSFTGTIAFMHCYGVTFINYEDGLFKDKAWTVLHNTVQAAVIKARKHMSKAYEMLQAYN